MQNVSRRPFSFEARLLSALRSQALRTMATSPTTTRSYNVSQLFFTGMCARDSHRILTHAWQDAIDALNTLQTPYEVIEARRKAGVKPDAASIKEMRTYLNRIGYSVRRTPSLSLTLPAPCSSSLTRPTDVRSRPPQHNTRSRHQGQR